MQREEGHRGGNGLLLVLISRKLRMRDGFDITANHAPPLTVGTTFVTAIERVHAVQDFALAENKAVKVAQKSGAHRHIVCTSDECTMFVRLYRKQVNKRFCSWYVSSMCLEHKNCIAIANPTRRQIARLPTFVSAVNADPTISAAALIDQVQSRDGIPLKKKLRTLYRAKETVASVSDDAVAASYRKLPSLLQQFSALNPGSVAIVEKDSCSRLERALVASKVFTDANQARQRVLGVDCAHSKCPSYSGVQTLLVGRDGDMRNVTVAFALVPAEDLASYQWFFSTLRSSGFDFSGVPIFCDRNPALLSAAESFGLELRYCTLHIIRNIQAAETKDEYASRLARLEMEVGDDVKRYLEEIPAVSWCVHANVGVVPLYGWRTSNFVESAFGTQLVKGTRSLHPFAFIDTMCSSLVDACYLRSQNATAWAQENLRVTPAARRIYDQQSANIGQHAVQHASDEVSYVWNKTSTVRIRRRVNKRALQCTCPFGNQRGVPCHHLIAALQDAGELERVYGGFDTCYLVPTYVSAFRYKAVLVPLESELTEDPTWLPPVVTRRPGRPKPKRIRSAGESDDGSVYRCSKCHQRGHNQRGCTMP